VHSVMFAKILGTGLDHQTLEKVDTTDSDKRSELCLYLLGNLGVATTGAKQDV